MSGARSVCVASAWLLARCRPGPALARGLELLSGGDRSREPRHGSGNHLAMNVETSSRVAGITNSGTDKSAERAQSSVTFVGGTLLVEGPASEELVRASNRNQLSKRDTLHNDVGLLRVPAYWFGDIASRADQRGHTLRGDLREAWGVAPASWEHLQLRAYQEEALLAWLVDRRGVIAMPTGAGKTKVAVAALLACGVPSVILCPTRALLAHWSSELSTTIREHIGVVGDGQRRLERVTVMTFESAYRHLDEIGDRFGLLVVDEVHHFASGARAEALEVCAAPYRLGLSATAPPSGSQGAARLDDLIGPVVMEISIAELVGKHLAPASILTIPVELEPSERSLYDRWVAPFARLRRAFFAVNRRATYDEMLRSVSSSTSGSAALRDYANAVGLTRFPRAKERLVSALLARHRAERTIVFTARVDDAYRIAERDLIPVITAEVSSREARASWRSFAMGECAPWSQRAS